MSGFFISLGAAAAWGVADFYGATETRRSSAYSVLSVTQPLGLVLALILIAVIGGGEFQLDQFGWATLAGFVGLGGIAFYFMGMAAGTISVVAPVATLGVIVPVIFGIVNGEVPSTMTLIGIVIGIGAIVFLSYEEDPEHKQGARRGLIYGVLAGLGFGLFFVFFDLAEAREPGWAIVGSRLGGTLSIALVLLLTRTRPSPLRESAKWLVLIAVMDVLANGLFGLATTQGTLPVVSVGASMYPLFVIALAHITLGERLHRLQMLGGLLALGGSALIVLG